MSLKDEIEALIKAEEGKLKEGDRKQADYHETQRRQFAPLIEILREITSPVDPKYIEVSIEDDSASDEGHYRVHSRPHGPHGP